MPPRLIADPPAPVGKLRLNLGCGEDWMPGAINIDARHLIPPEGVTFLRADVAELSNYFEDGCAGEIWAKDVLEHFPMGQIGAVLTEWIRLLAVGGMLHLKTPDLYALATFILNGTETDEVKAFRVYGGQTYPENFHKAGLTEGMFRRLLEQRGLRVVYSRIVEGTNRSIASVKMGIGSNVGGSGNGTGKP